MYWIALSPKADVQAWCWWSLRFTPRVARVEEALLLEVSGSLRLFGGRKRLLKLLLRESPGLGDCEWAVGPTSLVALALLRMKLQTVGTSAHPTGIGTGVPDVLPLDLLTAAQPHVPLLERTGIRTWGQLRALPRAGLSRRFGAGLLQALDQAYGEQPESHPWQVLPDAFDLGAELASLATSAPDLLVGAEQLMQRLQLWLQARNRGVLAVELEWTLDLRRLNGVKLPPQERLVVRTAQPTQDITHLRRLLSEQLSRTTLSAPANHLRLRSLETVPWGGATTSLLPQERLEGERLHQLVERLSIRLGEDKVVVPASRQDHRPEAKQCWRPAREGAFSPALEPDALYPAWVLPQPLKLRMQGEVPCFGGPLRRLARLYRVETAWWEPQGPTLRDYFVASSPTSGLVWIYRERPRHLAEELAQARQFDWYLQGVYA